MLADHIAGVSDELDENQDLPSSEGYRHEHRHSAMRTDEEHSMKVSSYHSSNDSDPDVYHDYDNCPTGQQIPSYNKLSGTGGYLRCKQCVAKD